MNKTIGTFGLGWALVAVVVACANAAPEDPVRKLMEAVEHNYTPEIEEDEDYFSEERLNTIYSRAFVTSFRAASARITANDEKAFEIDDIIHFQNVCMMTDITIDAETPERDFVPVRVTFLPYRCVEGDPVQDQLRTIVFRVINESGRDVIADIFQIDASKRAWSIKEKMDRIDK